jgi:hypothetical protein
MLYAFLCGALKNASDIRFYLDVLRLYKALHSVNQNATIKVYSNNIRNDAVRVATIAGVVNVYAGTDGAVGVGQELDATGINISDPRSFLTDIAAVNFTPADKVILYLTDHGNHACLFHGVNNADCWSPIDVCTALTPLRDAGIPTLIFLSFCGSGFWLRSLRFFCEDRRDVSKISAVADDISGSHEGGSFNIYSTHDPNTLIGTQFLQKLLVFLSNYRTGESVTIRGFHDTLDAQHSFGGYYGGNGADDIMSYFGDMNAFSSALVRQADVQYFSLRKTFANVAPTATASLIISRWTPRLQRLISHLLGSLPSQIDLLAVDVGLSAEYFAYVKAVQLILLDSAFIIVPEYDGEFAIFLLANNKITVQNVKEAVASIITEFN